MTDLEILGTLLATLSIILLPLILFIIGFVVVVIIAEWNFFKKCEKNGWEVLIPFYNTWVLIEISGLNWWYFLIILSPTIISLILGTTILNGLLTILSLFTYFLIYYNIAKKTKQNEILFGILGIFAPFIAIMILGFSKNINYDKNIEVDPNGIFKKTQ